MVHTIIFDIGGTLIGGSDFFKALSDEIRKFYNIESKEELGLEFQKLYYGENFYEVKSILNIIVKNILQKKGIDNWDFEPSEFYKKAFFI